MALSEPSSGSGLASLRTGAIDDGDCQYFDSQKIWIAGGHAGRRLRAGASRFRWVRLG